MEEERKTITFRLGCLGLLLLFYVTPGLLASIVVKDWFAAAFYLAIASMFGLWLAVPPSKSNLLIIRRLRFFSVMAVLLSVTVLLLWIGSGKAGGTFTYEISAGIGAGAGEGGVTREGPLNDTVGRVIFGGLGIFIGWLTLRFGVPYGRQLMKETSPKPDNDEIKGT